MNSKTSILRNLVAQADAYTNIKDLEKLADDEKVLVSLPIQPLYMAVHSSGPDQVSEILPKLSKEQRQALLDLDMWHKDVLDIEQFDYWPSIYSKCTDLKVVKEFSKSDQFLLYLKSVCNVYTFDLEDPQYPDHDNFFLTDDSLILIEYSEEFKFGNELKFFINCLYGDVGPTNAYKLLFKIVSESHMGLTEELYQKKKESLRDYGFVDYYDALEFRTTFNNENAISGFMKKKTKITGGLDDIHRSQALHSYSITPFKAPMEDLDNELAKVEDQKRSDYLQFNFIRLVNSTLTLENALKEGPMAMNRVGKIVKQYIELGFNKVSSEFVLKEDDHSLFEYFDFSELFKVGHSLIEMEQKKIKKALATTTFDAENDHFYGHFWGHYLDACYDEQVRFVEFSDMKGKIVNNLSLYQSWKSYNEVFLSLLPFMEKFFSQLQEIISTGNLLDDYYLNYDLAEIDFESLILSSFINYSNNSAKETKKLGVGINELVGFINQHFNFEDNEHQIKPFNGELKDCILSYADNYGFKEIKYFDTYLYQILRDNLEGYNFNMLEREEFKHVGGPILFSESVN